MRLFIIIFFHKYVMKQIDGSYICVSIASCVNFFTDKCDGCLGSV